MNSLNESLDVIKSGDTGRLRQMIRDFPLIAMVKTDQGISLLQFAAYCRNQAAIEILKGYKKKLNVFEAVSVGDTDIVKNLTDQNPDLINSFSPDGFTPLGLASFFGHTKIVELLLNNGADPNIAANNQFKVAPLHSACAISDYNIASILIKNGADVNAKQMQGVTSLHSAAHNGQTKLVKLLIESGADVNAQMDNGRSPLAMADEKGFNETALLIKQFGGR